MSPEALTDLSIGLAVDAVNRIETPSIDFIPEAERHSKPRDLAWVFGTQITYRSIMVGALPVAFELG
jgi:purine-cytosine permease-like protein